MEFSKNKEPGPPTRQLVERESPAVDPESGNPTTQMAGGKVGSTLSGSDSSDKIQTTITSAGNQDKNPNPAGKLMKLMKQQNEFLNILFQEIKNIKDLKKQ